MSSYLYPFMSSKNPAFVLIYTVKKNRFTKVKFEYYIYCMENDKYRKTSDKMLFLTYKLLRHQQCFQNFPAICVS
jgi:hypothetical protein